MTRIALLGANGKIGTELCLMLANWSDVEAVPICRSRFGSAFLRYHGIPCRHGSVAEEGEARALVGDCDVVVNLALPGGGGRPGEARRDNQKLIRATIESSAPSAKIIFFSTAMVYGDPRPDAGIRWVEHYGREKLAGEKLARRVGKGHGNDVYILRPGHVFGPLQPITTQIRDLIREGPVPLFDGDLVCNGVFTATILDAILKISGGREKPGTYDLMCQPEWTWRELFEYQAEADDLPLAFTTPPLRKRTSGLKRFLRNRVAGLGRNEFAKETLSTLVSKMSKSMDRRVQAYYFTSRAQRDIGALPEPPQDHPTLRDKLTWPPLARNSLSHLDITRDVLVRPEFKLRYGKESDRFPPDIPPFDPSNS